MSRALSNVIKLARTISVTDSGAYPDGVECRAAVHTAITRAIALAPCRLVFPPGTYRLDTPLGAFFGSDVVIDLNGSTLDFSNVATSATTPLLAFEGSYGTGVALTSNAAANQTTLAVTSSSFAVGDMVRVYSNAVVDPSRTASKAGEINFVDAVPGGTSLTLKLQTQDAYNTADTAKVEKLTPVRNVTICNGRMVGPSGNDEMLGVRFRVGINCHLKNMRSVDMDRIHAQFTDCTRSGSEGNTFENSTHASMGYGVSFADCSQDCWSRGDTFDDIRHSISTNNTSSSFGMVRRIQFRDFNITDSAPASGGSGGDAIDTHACAEDIHIGPGIVHRASNAGVNFEARSGSIRGVHFKHTVSVGIFANNYTDRKGQITIEGNTFDQIGDGSGTDPAIYVLAQTASGGYDRVTIGPNTCRLTAASEAIRVQGINGSNPIDGLSISGGSYATVGQTVMQLRDVQNGAVSGGSYRAAGYIPILLDTVDTTTVAGLNVTYTRGDAQTTSYGIRLIGTGTRNQITGNVVHLIGGGYTNSYPVHLAVGITNTGVHCNNAAGHTDPVELGAGAGNAEANNIA